MSTWSLTVFFAPKCNCVHVVALKGCFATTQASLVSVGRHSEALSFPSSTHILALTG